MALRFPPLPRRARSGALFLTLAPAIGLATFAIPCDCPDHIGGVQMAHASAAHLPAPAMPGMTMHAGMTSTDTSDDGTDTSIAAFAVGTPTHPPVVDGPEGALWQATEPSPPGETRHGTFAQQTVAAQLERTRLAAQAPADDDSRATRAELATTQATKQLSARCQKLIKQRASKLRRADRKRRTACLAKRRELVEASSTSASTGGTGTKPTGGTAAPNAPAAPIVVPAPAGPGPTPTVPVDPGPSTPGGLCAQPAVSVTARDVNPVPPYRLSRGSAAVCDNGLLNVQMLNDDRQSHNLWIQQSDKPGTRVAIFADVAAGESPYVDIQVAPGNYQLLCTIPGHEAMVVPFVVTASTLPG